MKLKIKRVKDILKEDVWSRVITTVSNEVWILVHSKCIVDSLFSIEFLLKDEVETRRNKISN